MLKYQRIRIQPTYPFEIAQNRILGAEERERERERESERERERKRKRERENRFLEVDESSQKRVMAEEASRKLVRRSTHFYPTELY